VGNKPLTGPPQKEEFKDYSHYSEHFTQLFGKVYYYKRKSDDQLYMVRPVPKKDIEGKLKKIRITNTEIMKKAGNTILAFRGVQEDLPNMSSLKVKDLCFLTFDSFDHDLHYEISKRLLKSRPLSAEEGAGRVPGSKDLPWIDLPKNDLDKPPGLQDARPLANGSCSVIRVPL
jgi:hypothetical protein